MKNKEDLSNVSGIAYRNKTRIIINDHPGILKPCELSDMSMLENLKSINHKRSSDVLIMEAGRGCPFSCTFCSTNVFWKQNHRMKSVHSLINDIIGLNIEYGYRMFAFMHDNFTLNKKHLHDFCSELLKVSHKFVWGCSSRIDTLDYETIDLMKQSGCRWILVGLETGSPRMQKLLNKNISVEAALEKIMYIKNIGISINVSLMYGFPDETLDDFIKTMNIIETLIMNKIRTIDLNKFMPLPKTEEFKKVADKLYFNKAGADYSISIKISSHEGSTNLIRQYIEIFPQFYSFDSVVRTKYKHMNFFLSFLLVIFADAFKTVSYLTKKYGIIALYDIMYNDIELAFDEYADASLSEHFNVIHSEISEMIVSQSLDKSNVMRKLYIKFVSKLLEIDDDTYFKKIATLEFQKNLSALNDGDIYKFDVDIVS